jgi:lipopolysaccharide export system protein LptA
MRFLTLPFLLFITIVVISQSSSKIRIIHADLNLGRKVQNEQIRILKGSVHVVKDTTHMYCDSAYFYESKNTLEFLGNVIVENGQRTIKANKILYFPDDNLTECIGYVRATSKTDSLFTHHLIYNLERNEASASDSVYLWSKNDHVIITGDYGYFDEANSYFRVNNNAHFVQIDSATKDSFQVLAQKLEYYGDTLNYAYAEDSVRLWQGNLKAVSDTSWYYSNTETVWLKGKPITWFENNELQGKEIKIKFDSSKVERLNVYGDAQAKTINDSVKNEYNLLKGKSIEFFIKEKKPDLVISRLNASSKYFLSQEADQGSNYSTSDSIYVFFKLGVVDSIEIIGGAEGTYYPDSFKGERKFGE